MPGPTPPSNQAPKAEFEITCDDLRCSFRDESTDEDGNIESRAWDFGDGATLSQRNPTHSYASAGQYDVTLVVTDDDGAADTRTRTAVPESPQEPPPPPPSNKAPQAEFDLSCDDLRCSFSDRSTDQDGAIESRAWDFGDGATSTQRNPSHSYASPGQYEVSARRDGRLRRRGGPPGRARRCRSHRRSRRRRPTSRRSLSSRPSPGASLHLPGPERGRRRQCHKLGMGLRGRRDVQRAEPVALVRIAGKLPGAAPGDRRRWRGRHRTHTVRAESPPPPPPPPAPENKAPKAEFRVDCSGLTCVFTDDSKDDDGVIVSSEAGTSATGRRRASGTRCIRTHPRGNATSCSPSRTIRVRQTPRSARSIPRTDRVGRLNPMMPHRLISP